jgi:HK97 family phage prohead protease
MPKTIEGFAAVFHNANDPGSEYRLAVDVVERIAPTAFDHALKSNAEVLAYYNHNGDFLLGRRSAGTLRLSKDSRGLRYSIDFNESDPHHRSVMEKIQRGDLIGSSFSFGIRSGGEKVERTAKGFVRTLTDLRLYEVSPVGVPAYRSTTAMARSNAAVGSVRWCVENPEAAKRHARLRHIEREQVLDRIRYLELTR